MIRTPHEPADSMLRMQLGHATPKPANKPPVAPPFTEYTAIKNRPGWEDDGYGHLRYNGLPDAMKHERAETEKIRVAKDSLAAFKRLEGGINDVQLVRDDRVDAEHHAADAFTYMASKVKTGKRFTTPEQFAHEYMMDPYDRNKDPMFNSRCVITPEMRAELSRLQRQEQPYVGNWAGAARVGIEGTSPDTMAEFVETEDDRSVQLRRMFTCNPGVFGFECTQGKAFYTEPIDGVTVTLHEGDTRGRGPLVTFDRERLIETDTLHTLKRYISDLRNCMPADVPLFVKRHSGTIGVWRNGRLD